MLWKNVCLMNSNYSLYSEQELRRYVKEEELVRVYIWYHTV